jgi:predicted dehydrogenase
MAKKPLRIGLIGYGFMGRAHSNAFAQAGHFFPSDHQIVLQAVCGRDAAAAQKFADKWGYQSIETDWKKLIARKDIDLIDIATPNNLHSQQAVAAAQAGKMILCEKPLGLNAKDAEKMVAAVEKAKVPNMVWYNYRRCPAVTLAKHLIDAGKLGRVFHYRANFLQDWTISPDLPQGGTGLWRLDAKVSGSGVTGDLLAHCIDTAMWLNGGIKDVCAMTETFIKARKHTLTGKTEKVTIDDACAFLCHFDNGSLGLFESTRYARGHKALYTFEINGEHMSLKWDLHDLHRLQIFDHKDAGTERGWKSVHVSDGDHPYCGNWWVPGLQLGYEHSFVHQVADFLQALDTGKPARPNFKDGLACDYVVDAVLASGKKKTWEKVPKPKGWK